MTDPVAQSYVCSLVEVLGSKWDILGVSNSVEVTTTAHALVTTGISGLAAGDLLVACIASRIASVTPITLPTGGEWALVGQQNANSVLTTSSGVASALMAYCVRGASNPNLTFTHPTAPSVAIGRIVAYRGGLLTGIKDTPVATGTTAINTTSVSVTGITTLAAKDLLVGMMAGGQEANWSNFRATTPGTGSGATDTTTAPTSSVWQERADAITTTGADTSLGIFDAVKETAGATGNFLTTASVGASHAMVVGAFKVLTLVDKTIAADVPSSAYQVVAGATANLVKSGGAKAQVFLGRQRMFWRRRINR